MNLSITHLDSRVVFMPVRHHSPACARIVRSLALELKPSALLIEGPADFNDRFDELHLDHQLPLAIYSYVQMSDDTRRGAFYPFCLYSPEWQALQTAREIGAHAEFIDLPWAELAEFRQVSANRYADGELRRSSYVERLCRDIGVEDWDSLWDTLFEIDESLNAAQFLERCHHFCYHSRVADEFVRPVDLHREEFMAARIREALQKFDGRILVVTGGFHSYGLFARLNELPFDHNSIQSSSDNVGSQSLNSSEESIKESNEFVSDDSGDNSLENALAFDEKPLEVISRGIALTPYSYERLDNLTGYESGMPNPGFYHQVWQDRTAAQQSSHKASYRELLAQAVKELRHEKQIVSTADLVAVETMAQGLAALRGHSEIWRRDLIDAITGALVKEEMEQGLLHPFLAAIHRAFRGKERGRLAAGTMLPPLVHDLQRLLREFDLEPASGGKQLELDLHKTEDQPRSRLLHSIRVLGIAGFTLTGGTDLTTREDLSEIVEQWRIRWSPEYEAACIEAAIYGATLADAVTAKLKERCDAIERDAAAAALILLDACRCGQTFLSVEFSARLIALIREDGSFYSVAAALDHLLYLYRYDEIFGTRQRADLGALLRETFERALWLLESSGQEQGREKDLIRGLRGLLHTFERCGDALQLDRETFVSTLHRVADESVNQPLLRGATAGALWTLNEMSLEQLQRQLNYCASPERLGDYLTGLFALARETVQRNSELLLSVDQLLTGFTEDEFLEALPALRLAFSFFTPREKHYLASTLLKASGLEESEPLPTLEADALTVARVMAFEAKLFAVIERYGLREATEREA